jgi:O-methyltransferase
VRFSQIRVMVKERIAKSGLRGFHRMQALGVLLEFGKWLKDHECEAVFESRYDLYQYVNSETVENAPIDYLEFGVYRGDSIIYWTQLNRDQNSRFFGFDSFEGLPEDWEGFSGVALKGSFGVGGRIPQVNDPRVEFVKGYFQTVLPDFLKGFAAKNRLIVHCDADLYTSTLCVLVSLNQVMVPGSIVLFDEFSTVSHEFRAFRDYTKSFMRDYKLLAASNPFYTQVAIEMA